jgi:hypothetical protein
MLIFWALLAIANVLLFAAALITHNAVTIAVSSLTLLLCCFEVLRVCDRNR